MIWMKICVVKIFHRETLVMGGDHICVWPDLFSCWLVQCDTNGHRGLVLMISGNCCLQISEHWNLYEAHVTQDLGRIGPVCFTTLQMTEPRWEPTLLHPLLHLHLLLHLTRGTLPLSDLVQFIRGQHNLTQELYPRKLSWRVWRENISHNKLSSRISYEGLALPWINSVFNLSW